MPYTMGRSTNIVSIKTPTKKRAPVDMVNPEKILRRGSVAKAQKTARCAPRL
jgi:hypothetical protein